MKEFIRGFAVTLTLILVFATHGGFAGTVHVLSDITESVSISNNKTITITGPEESDSGTGITDDALTVTLKACDVYEIINVEDAFQRFTIAGNYTSLFLQDTTFEVTGSTGNDGVYTVMQDATLINGTDTAIKVNEAIDDSTEDGVIVLPGTADHVFTIDNTAGAVTIQNLKITGSAGYDAINIAGTNAGSVNVLNCDFPPGPTNVVNVLDGSGNGPVTIQYSNIGAGAGETVVVGVANADANITVNASNNWWNSYFGPNGGTQFGRAAATTSGAVTTTGDTDGQYRVDTDTALAAAGQIPSFLASVDNDNVDPDDDGDTTNDTDEAAATTNPAGYNYPADVYVNAAWDGTTVGQTVNPGTPNVDLTFGYDAFATITDGVAGVADGP